jgi:hypothetical protein
VSPLLKKVAPVPSEEAEGPRRSLYLIRFFCPFAKVGMLEPLNTQTQSIVKMFLQLGHGSREVALSLSLDG